MPTSKKAVEPNAALPVLEGEEPWTPEEVAENPDSFTGAYLKRVFQTEGMAP